VLATVLLTRSALLKVDDEPDDRDVAPRLYTYRIDVVDVVERYFYRPLSRGVLIASRTARNLQSGRLDAYMAYMLIAVLAVLAVVIATS
jgi:hydrogenase-4 component B